MKAIQRHCLRMCNENETRLQWKNLYRKCNFYRTIKIWRKITFVIMTSELSYYNHKWTNYDYTYEFLWKRILVTIKLFTENDIFLTWQKLQIYYLVTWSFYLNVTIIQILWSSILHTLIGCRPTQKVGFNMSSCGWVFWYSSNRNTGVKGYSW